MEARLNYKAWRKDFDNAKTAAEKTHLLSVRAHITGKQHMSRARVTWAQAARWGKLEWDRAREIAANGGSTIVDVDREDQLELAGNDWQKYVELYDMVVPNIRRGFFSEVFHKLFG